MSAEAASGRGAAKVILLGEHAVVHGAAALAVSLSTGVIARATKVDHRFQLSVPAWDLSVSAGDGSDSEKALLALVDVLGLSLDGLSVNADARVPARSGLGASAAIAAAVAKAVASVYGKTVSDETLFEAVQASERVFHGTPSGIDARLSLGEGVITFSIASGVRSLAVSAPRLLVVHSGEPGDTRHTVRRFREKIRQVPEQSNRRIAEMEDLVERGIGALEQMNSNALGEIMVRNHEILSWFGVSTPRLDEIVGLSLEAGALGAKLTGGGGGGCAIVLAGDAEAVIARRLQGAGFSIIPV